jgi:hypothetical protein
MNVVCEICPLNTRNDTKISEMSFSFIRVIRVFRGHKQEKTCG